MSYYAAACHDVIHTRIARQLGRRPVARVENHHNFAWKEQVEGRELIVHRKGATPAGKNVRITKMTEIAAWVGES